MADETKKVETTTTEEKVDAEPVEEETTEEAQATEETTTEEKKDDKSSSPIDYEAELKKEREAREKAEKALAKEAFKERKAKRQEPEESEEDEEEEVDEEDKPLTAKALKSVLAAERQETQRLLQKREIESLAKELADSDSQANYLVELHRNRTFPSHLSLREQLIECYGIANSKTLMAKNAELKRALLSKQTKKTDAAGTERDVPLAGEVKLNPNDAQAIKAAGMVWDGAKRLYKKPLSGGKKHLYFNPKTGKRWTAQ